MSHTMTPEEIKEYADKSFNDYWKSLICDDSGNINIDQVKIELADYEFILSQVGEVYCHITGNRLSKSNYFAQVVIDEADRHYEEQSHWYEKTCLSCGYKEVKEDFQYCPICGADLNTEK